MKHQSPQVGQYKVFNAYYEMHNGKPTPVAEVTFKGQGWENEDKKLRKIRLRALYNPSSDGPVIEYPVTKLYLHILNIKEMVQTNDSFTGMPIYSIKWDVIKPTDYNDMIQQENELVMDHALQMETQKANYELLLNELDCMDLDQLDSERYMLEVDTHQEDITE